MMLDFRTLVTDALAHLENDRPADAERNIRAALGMNPRDDQLLHLLGVSLIRQSREVEAIEPLKKAIALNRRDPEYHNALGCALRNTDRIDEGIESFLRALRLAPELHEAHYNLALAYQAKHEFARAEQRFRYVLERNPADIETVNGLSSLHWLLGDYEQSLRCLREAIRINPSSGDLRYGLAERLLALGHYEEGWFCYLWRVNRHFFLRKFSLPFDAPGLLEPFAENLAGRTVHIHAEQGIGDDLYFLRFAAFLRQRGARVVGAVTPRLMEMVRRSRLLDSVEPAPERTPPSLEYRLLGDLPHLLRASYLPIPDPVRFDPLPERVAAVAARTHGLERPLIGLTWRAGTGPGPGDRNVLYKEVPFKKFLSMAQALPGTLAVLQRGPKPEELERLMEVCGPRVVDFSDLNADLEAMLALLAQLDDHVGVSNTNMHLCAGLGRGARVLVSRGIEFRWMAEGIESPWFRGFAIYRQALGGDWSDALKVVGADVRREHENPLSTLSARK